MLDCQPLIKKNILKIMFPYQDFSTVLVLFWFLGIKLAQEKQKVLLKTVIIVFFPPQLAV